MSMSFSNDRPIYLQIVEFMKMDIISGKYKQGEKLPSVRELAAVYKVNPNTMQRAFAELENIQLVYTERTNGRFVAKDKEVMENIKKQIATTKVKEFLHYMNSLGIDDKEIINYVSMIRKGGNV